MVYIVAIAIALGFGQLLFALGVPPEVVWFTSLLALLFWHRFLGFVVMGTLKLSLMLQKAGLPGADALRSAMEWLAANEGVRALDGGWMQPPDVDDIVEETTTNAAMRAQQRAEEKAAREREKAEAAALKAQAKAIFDAQSQEAVFLIPESNASTSVRSKIGGQPMLAPGQDWPGADEGYGMHFLAEIHLGEVPRTHVHEALPQTGVLYFFIDLGEYSDLQGGRVLYAPEPGRHPAKRPPNLQPLFDYFIPHPSHDNILNENRVRPTVAILPTLVDFDYGDAPHELCRALGDVGRARYAASVRAAQSKKARNRPLPDKNYVYNMIGGPRLDVPNPTSGRGVKLLQLDSSASLGLQFGDMGVLEFWIDEDDLRMGRFDRAYADNASC